MYCHKDRHTDKSPEKDLTDTYGQITVDKGAKIIQWEWTIFPTNGVLKTRYSHVGEKKKRCMLTLNQMQVNSKWIKDLNTRDKTLIKNVRKAS